MSAGLLYELTITGMSFVTGVGLMVVYDLLRFLRIVIPHRPFWTGVEDLGFWIYAGIMTFGLLYEMNEGTLRGYAIAVVLLGMILYDRICSRIWLKVLKNVRKYIKMKTNNKVGDIDEGKQSVK